MSKELVGLSEKLRARFFLSLLRLWVINVKNESEIEKYKKIEDLIKMAKKIEQIILHKRPKGKHGMLDINSIMEMNKHLSEKINEHALKKMECSIKKFGLKNPPVVQEVETGFQVVSGYLRYEACKRLNMAEIPVIIREFTNKEDVELSLLDALLRDGQEDVEPEWLSPLLKFYNQRVN